MSVVISYRDLFHFA